MRTGRVVWGLAIALSVGCTAKPDTAPPTQMGSSTDMATDAGPASLPPPAPSAWSFEHPQPTGNALRAVWARGNTAYAVGALGTVVRSTTAGPTAVIEANGLTRASLNAVTGVADDVWAVGEGGVVLHRQAGTWSIARVGTKDLYTVFADAAGILYAAGQGDSLWKYDGATWSRSSLPGQTAEDVCYAGAASGDLLILVGSGVSSGGRILRGDRTTGSWQREAVGLLTQPLRAVLLAADGSGYAVGGNGLIVRRDAKAARWTLDLPTMNPPHVELRAVLAQSDAVYAVAETGLTLRRGSDDWQPVPSDGLSHIAGGSGDDSGSWVVGAGGQLWHRGPAAADAWRSALPAPVLTTSDLTAITAAGDGTLYALAEEGTILRRSAAGTWQLDGRSPSGQPLYGLWAQGEEAYAVGSGGTILTRRAAANWQAVRYNYPDDRPDWRGVLGLGPQREVLVVGSAVATGGAVVAAVLHGTPAVDLWEQEPLDSPVHDSLYAIASGGSTVLAVGGSGTVLRRTGSRWGREWAGVGSEVQLVSIAALGSAPASDFYATGTHGALLFRDGSKPTPTWTRATLFGDAGAVTVGGVLRLGTTGELWAVGDNGQVGYRSSTGTWRSDVTPTVANLRGLAILEDTLVAVGAGGVILRRGTTAPPR